MSEDSSTTISQQECLIKAEHIILEKKPFILISIDEHNGMMTSQNLIHTANTKGVRSKLDIATLEYTKHIHPIAKLMWAMSKENLMEGNKKDGNKD